MDSSLDNKKELLSVIIPVYNTADTVERAVQSVLNQSWKNIEIIMVDDGSPDDAGEICDGLAETYRNVIVIHNNNEGPGKARNNGLDVAKGRYVAFLDSDDWVDSETYETCIRQLLRDDSQACYFGRKVYNKDGSYQIVSEKPSRHIYRENEVIDEFAPRLFGEWRLSHEEKYIRESASCALYDRLFIEKHGIRFLQLRLCEDLFFNLDICRYAKGISIIPQDMYNQGFNQDSLTTKRDPKRLDKIKCMYIHLLEYAKKYPEIVDKYQRIYYRVISYIRGLIRDEAIAEERFADVLALVGNVANDLVLKQVYSAILVEQFDNKTRTFIKWLRNKSIYKIAMFYRIKGRIKR